jgi:hypothetical protein
LVPEQKDFFNRISQRYIILPNLDIFREPNHEVFACHIMNLKNYIVGIPNSYKRQQMQDNQTKLNADLSSIKDPIENYCSEEEYFAADLKVSLQMVKLSRFQNLLLETM